MAQDALDTENNDYFDAPRQVVDVSPNVATGTFTVSGNITPGIFDPFAFDPFAADFALSGSLTPGGVVALPQIAGLAPGQQFYAAIDNFDPNSPFMFSDTTLGRFNNSGGLVGFDDDSSPLGDGFLGSALGGRVSNEGTLNFQVTGFGDSGFFNEDLDGDGVDDGLAAGVGFDGLDDFFGDPHFEEGDFTLYVDLLTADEFLGDVDFYTFEGLVPGSRFTLEITDEVFLPDDWTIALFDDAGQLLNQVSGVISGIVSASGLVNVAVSGWEDLNLDGIGDALFDVVETGAYDLVLTGEFVRRNPGGDPGAQVPVPGTLLLLGAGLLALARRGGRATGPAPLAA